MRKFIVGTALSFCLTALAAFAQTATTPGAPSPRDPNYQGNTVPDTSAPPQYPPDERTTDRDHSSGDQQQYPDTQSAPDARSDRDRDNSQTQDEDHHDRSNQDIDRDRDSQRDRTPQSDQPYSHQGDRDRSDSPNDYDHDRYQSSDYRDQIQSALQQSNLSNVQVRDNGSNIELTGSVPSSHDRSEAMKIAQSYAHGRQVVDRIQVGGDRNGYDHDRDNDKH
jgi:hypothetical protein